MFEDCDKDWYLTSKIKYTDRVLPFPIIKKVCRNFKQGLHFDLVEWMQ